MSFSDQLSIDTPEQITLEYDIAGLGSRFLALLLDSIIQWAAFFLCTLLLALFGLSLMSKAAGSGNWALAFISLFFFLVYWGYFAIFETFWNGQTPGKRVLRIRVLNESGRQVRFYEVAIRNLLRVVDALPGFYAVGLISCFVSARNKRIGDYLAGTIVVHDRKPSDSAVVFNTQSARAAAGLDLPVIAVKDVEVIEAFLHRRLDLDYQVRRNTAFRLAEHFGKRYDIAQDRRKDDENFLESLVIAFRSR